MKKLIPLALLMLAACKTTGPIQDIPDKPGPGPEIVVREVPVPVLCRNSATAPALDIYSVRDGASLEEQNAALRATIAQQAQFILDLAAALVGCGGEVN